MDFLGQNFRMGRLMGIPIYINISLPIFLLIVMLMNLGSNPFTAVILPIIAMVFVLMHEYAHALTARAFGAHTGRIVLHIFGGLAETGSVFSDMKRLVVFLAGPASNFIMAFALATLYSQFGGYWLKQCIFINMVLGLFNLLPAYPLDGGQSVICVLKKFGASTKFITQTIFLLTTASCIFIVMYLGSGSFNVVMIAILIWLIMFSQYRTGRFKQ